MMDLRGRKVIVVGTGKSGIGSAVLLEQKAHCQSYMMEMNIQTKRP